MTGSLGDFSPGKIIYGKFTTYRPSTGAPHTLAGSPTLHVYKDNSTTESAAGVTLTVDFDGRTGLHHFAIDTSADGSFYSAGAQFDVIITAGTVDSVSAVGTVVGRFSLTKTSPLRSTVADRTLDVSAGGEAGIDWANIGSPTATVALTNTTSAKLVDDVWDEVITGAAHNVQSSSAKFLRQASFTVAMHEGTAQAGTGTTLTLDAAASTTNNIYNDERISILEGAGAGQSRLITGYVGATRVATVDHAWTVTPDNTSVFAISGASVALARINHAGATVPTVTTLTNGVTVTTNNDKTGYSISGTKTTLDALNDLNAAGIRSAVGLASANMDTQLSAIAGYIDTEVGAIKAVTDAIGATGTGLSAIPWNPAWDVEVESECADALNAYDPPTNAEMVARTLATSSYATSVDQTSIKTVTDKLDTALELDGAVYRYTLNALEQAPTGGSAPTAAQIRTEIDSNSTQLAAIKAKTDGLTYTVSGVVDANVQRVNDVTIIGDGSSGSKFRV